MSAASPLVAGFIYARSDSSRLPGKILMSIEGHSILRIVYERSLQTKLDCQFLVTTDRGLDDDLCRAAEEIGLPVIRGDAHDLVRRTEKALDLSGAEYFLRLNGDSPLIDNSLINYTIGAAREFDFVSNLFDRRFPYGISAELMRADFFKKSVREARALVDREHITQHLYREEIFGSYGCVNQIDDHSRFGFVVDLQSELDELRRLCAGRDVITVPYWELTSLEKPEMFLSAR